MSGRTSLPSARPLRRYARLLGIFWRNTLATELEYRVRFWSNIALSTFWLAWAAAGVAVYFRFTDTVQGWSYAEMLVVVGLFFAINGLHQLVLQPNLRKMTEYVRDGTLDFLLTKPVNSQFMVSFRHVGVYNAVDPLLGLGLTAIGLAASDRSLSASRLAAFAIAAVAAVVLLYAIAIAMMSLSLRSVSSHGIDDLISGMLETARVPTPMYRGVVQSVLTFVVPVAVFTTIPAELLLGRRDVLDAFAVLGIALVSVVPASLIWRRALRGYTGASG